MPIWGAIALAVGVALLTQICTFLIQERRLGKEKVRKDAELAAEHKAELDQRVHVADESQKQRAHEIAQRRREEWIKSVRWAADHIAEGSDLHLLIGVNTLDALDNEPDLTDQEQAMIDAILNVVNDDFDELDDF